MTTRNLAYPMTPAEHHHRVAVITGASSVGSEPPPPTLFMPTATAWLCWRGGSRRIEALATELGDDAIAVPADVTDRDALVVAARRIADELGTTDVLINNAGTMLLAASSPQSNVTTTATWSRST